MEKERRVRGSGLFQLMRLAAAQRHTDLCTEHSWLPCLTPSHMTLQSANGVAGEQEWVNGQSPTWRFFPFVLCANCSAPRKAVQKA
jgi:hypothetical protein